MKRLLSLVSLILCMALVLASCSPFTKKISFEKFYEEYEYEPTKTYSMASQIFMLDGHTRVDSSSYLITFETEDGMYYKVYNAKTDSVVLTLDATDTTVNGFYVFGVPFVKVTKTTTDANYITTTTVSIYGPTGTLVTSATNPSSSGVTVSADFFKFDGEVFKVNEDGSVTSSTNAFAYLPDLDDVKTENYYYCDDGDSVSVYDKDLNCVFYWEVPFEDYDESEVYLLSDGMLLAQVTEELPEDAKKYDYVDCGTKYNLHSYILNAEKGKAKEVTLDYSVDYVWAIDAVYSYASDNYLDLYPEKVTNWAEVIYINDQKLDARSTEVVIKSNGDVIELTPEFESVPYDAAENRWIEYRDNGERYLLNEEGEVIGNITGYDNRNEKFISTGTKLLNYDLQVVFDAKASGKVIYAMLNTAVILRDATANAEGDYNYYLYKADGTTTQIINFDNDTFGNGYYVTYDDVNQLFTVYSESGSMLTSVKGYYMSEVYSDSDLGITILRYTDTEGKTHFYKLS